MNNTNLISLMPLLFLVLCGLLAAYVVITQLIIPMLAGKKILPILKDEANLDGIYVDSNTPLMQVSDETILLQAQQPAQAAPIVKKRKYYKKSNKGATSKNTNKTNVSANNQSKPKPKPKTSVEVKPEVKTQQQTKNKKVSK